MLTLFTTVRQTLTCFFVFLMSGTIPLFAENIFTFGEIGTPGRPTAVILEENGKPLWQYNTDLIVHEKVPKNKPTRLAGCYIHPLYGIDGEILTDNAPKDHYHHHGVFWTWPHVALTEKDGTVRHFDTWLGNTEVKQRFVRILERKSEPDKAVFVVENGWFLAEKINEFKSDADGRPLDEKIMDERVTVTTRPIVEERLSSGNLRSRCIDLSFVWTVGEKPITLRGAEGKSYGGLTVRFHPSIGKPGKESVITVPSGVAREDLPDTPLPWADYTSCFHLDENGRRDPGKASGAAVFVPKYHPDYPPTWLTRYYGPLCVGWPGVNERTFRPHEKIELSYRLWIHDRRVDADTIRSAYEEYTKQAGCDAHP